MSEAGGSDNQRFAPLPERDTLAELAQGSEDFRWAQPRTLLVNRRVIGCLWG